MRSPIRRRLLGVLAGGAAVLLAATLAPAAAMAAGTPAVTIIQGDGPEALTVLMAGSAELSSGLAVNRPNAQPKHFYVEGFAPGRSAAWPVETEAAAEFHASVLINGEAGQQWRLSSGAAQIEFTTLTGEWDRIELGAIAIAAEDRVTIEPVSGGAGQEVKSVELVPENAWSALTARAAEFKAEASATRSEFSGQDWGLFFQYGPWSYPQTGPTKLDLEGNTDRFDVDHFADWVEELGAGYVIWSASWWTYQLQMPVDAVDEALGDGSRTSERNLISELATELKSRGIMFFLYYHTGQDEHLGYESTDFWKAQQWPSEFTATGSGDRTEFFDNWKSIVGELGDDLGENLDGWFFDDGLMYYPADFEALGAAARSGNSARLLSYNSWVMPSYTAFQDVSFGEDCAALPGAAGVGGDGIFTAGPQAGLSEQCMIRTENDWGVKEPNQQIQSRFTAEQLACTVKQNRVRNVPTTLGSMMWSPQPDDAESKETPSPDTIAIYEEMIELLDGESALINDTDPRLGFNGSWAYSSGRAPSAGDNCSDLHYTRENGAAATLSFEGTGATLLGPIDSDGVNAEILVDGVSQGSINETRPSYTAQQQLARVTGLSDGPHTLSLVKRGGSYLQVDAFTIEAGSPNDVTPPTTTIALAEPTASGWHTEAPVVSVTAIDEESEVAAIELRVNGGAWAPYTAPVPLGDEATLIEARSTDAAGNVSELAARELRIDTTKPTVRGDLAGNRMLTLTGTDAGSGIARIEYVVNVSAGAEEVADGVTAQEAAPEWREYSEPLRLGAEASEVQYRAVDVAGNVGESAVAHVPALEEAGSTPGGGVGLADTGAESGLLTLLGLSALVGGALLVGLRRGSFHSRVRRSVP